MVVVNGGRIMAKDRFRSVEFSRVEGWPKDIYDRHDLAFRAFNDAMTGNAECIERAYLAKDASGLVLGACFARWRRGWAFVDQLFVEEHARGDGLGRRLLEEALADARAAGLIGAWIDTINTAAKALYESVGFEVIGTLGEQLGATGWWLSLPFDHAPSQIESRVNPALASPRQGSVNA
jgi:GNAT superfamily N-acetyltransferase